MNDKIELRLIGTPERVGRILTALRHAGRFQLRTERRVRSKNKPGEIVQYATIGVVPASTAGPEEEAAAELRQPNEHTLNVIDEALFNITGESFNDPASVLRFARQLAAEELLADGALEAAPAVIPARDTDGGGQR